MAARLPSRQNPTRVVDVCRCGIPSKLEQRRAGQLKTTLTHIISSAETGKRTRNSIRTPLGEHPCVDVAPEATVAWLGKHSFATAMLINANARVMISPALRTHLHCASAVDNDPGIATIDARGSSQRCPTARCRGEPSSKRCAFCIGPWLPRRTPNRILCAQSLHGSK